MIFAGRAVDRVQATARAGGGRGHAGEADVFAGFAGAVDLVAGDDDVVVSRRRSRSPIAGSLIDSAIIWWPAATSAGSTSATGKPVTGRAVGLPCVQVPVEARLDDVRLLGEAFEVGERRARRGSRTWGGWSRSRAPARRTPGLEDTGKPLTRFAVGLPRVDVDAGGDDHVLRAVAGEVGDQRPARWLARQPERREAGRARVAQRRLLGVGLHGPAAQLRAVRLVGVDQRRPRSGRSAPGRCRR